VAVPRGFFWEAGRSETVKTVRKEQKRDINRE